MIKETYKVTFNTKKELVVKEIKIKNPIAIYETNGLYARSKALDEAVRQVYGEDTWFHSSDNTNFGDIYKDEHVIARGIDCMIECLTNDKESNQ